MLTFQRKYVLVHALVRLDALEERGRQLRLVGRDLIGGEPPRDDANIDRESLLARLRVAALPVAVDELLDDLAQVLAPGVQVLLVVAGIEQAVDRGLAF